MLNLFSQKSRAIIALIIGLFLLAGSLTLPDYGMGWDEITRWNSGDRKLEHYKQLFTAGESAFASGTSSDKYPGLFDLPLAAFHALVGGDRMLQGHFLSILFAALGLAATGWLARQIFGAPVAVLSVLFLALYPRFYGHAMMNPKDIPFLATYTLGLAAGFFLVSRFLQGGVPAWKHFILTGLAIGLAASSRMPGVSLMGVTMGLTVLALMYRYVFQQHTDGMGKELVRTGAGFLLSIIACFATLLLFFPRLQYQLVSGIPEVVSSLHTSANEMPLLFNGQLLDASEAPFAYPIRFFIIASPLWMLPLILIGFAHMARGLLRKDLLQDPKRIKSLFFLLALAFPWTYLLLVQPAIHDGLRHFLFAIPPVIIVAAVGAKALIEGVQERFPRYKILTYGILTVACLFQTLQLWIMHPYQYVAFNVLAGDRATIPNRFDTEYWCTSSRHLLEALPKVAEASDSPIKIRVAGALNSARDFVPEGFILTNSFKDAAYYVSNTNFRIDTLVDGEVIYTLERGGIPIGVIKRLSPAE